MLRGWKLQEEVEQYWGQTDQQSHTHWSNVSENIHNIIIIIYLIIHLLTTDDEGGKAPCYFHDLWDVIGTFMTLLAHWCLLIKNLAQKFRLFALTFRGMPLVANFTCCG